MKHIVSFSGGKDSTAMLIILLESNIDISEIVFCDTGMEYPEVYNHIEYIQSKLKLKITTLKSEKPFEYWMKKHIKTKGNNKNTLGYSWPDHRVRWCTKTLKTSVFKKYVRQIAPSGEIAEYHGIRIDEFHRTLKNNDGRNIIYPLCDKQITESKALKICYSNGFHWDNFYENHSRANCYCCPLQTLQELNYLYHNYPVLWANLKKLDHGTWRKFRKDYSLKDLEDKFNANS